MYIGIRVFARPRKGSILPKVIQMVWIHSTAATMFNLCCVSVDRFIAIRFPFRYQDIVMLHSDYNGLDHLTVSSFLEEFGKNCDDR